MKPAVLLCVAFVAVGATFLPDPKFPVGESKHPAILRADEWSARAKRGYNGPMIEMRLKTALRRELLNYTGGDVERVKRALPLVIGAIAVLTARAVGGRRKPGARVHPLFAEIERTIRESLIREEKMLLREAERTTDERKRRDVKWEVTHVIGLPVN